MIASSQPWNRLLLSIVWVCGAGCADSPSAPALPDGSVYVLHSVDGNSLPAVQYVTPELTVYVVADTLRLFSNGSGEHVAILEYEGPGPLEEPGATERESLAFQRNGNEIALTLVCPDLADCLAGPHYTGTIGRDLRLTFTYALGMTVPRVYWRAAP